MGIRKPSDVISLKEKFFKDFSVVDHQIQSYNAFVKHSIPKIIQEQGHFEVSEDGGGKHTITFSTPYIARPIHKEVSDKINSITPFECIQRDITYRSEVICDVVYTSPDGNRTEYKNVSLGYIPTMVKSNLCNITNFTNEELFANKEDVYDTGGYFIVNGSQKIITSQERPLPNKPIVFKMRKRRPYYTDFIEVKSASQDGSRVTTVQIGVIDGKISVIVPYIESAIPLSIMLIALGVENSYEILKYMVSTDRPVSKDRIQFLFDTLSENCNIQSQEDALFYIGRRGKKFSTNKEGNETFDASMRENAISYAKHLLISEFFPHMNVECKNLTVSSPLNEVTEHVFKSKLKYLAYLTESLFLTVCKNVVSADRDHFANKRIITCGILLRDLFNATFKKLKFELTNMITSHIKTKTAINIILAIKSHQITSAMTNCLTMNNWGPRKMQPISQVFDKFNYADAIANARKLVLQFEADGGKIEKPREIHSSHWGIMCPAETPEGKKTGLIKNLSMGAIISKDGTEDSYESIRSILMDIIMKSTTSMSPPKDEDKYTFFINGVLICKTGSASSIVKEFIAQRRTASFSYETSIAKNDVTKEVLIYTDAGRPLRPLLIVENGKLLFDENVHKSKSFIDLVMEGVIEFLDKSEEDYALIAKDVNHISNTENISPEEFTHCEIFPSMIFGIGASRIPFPHCNQSPRNTYQSAMGKQAIGIPGVNYAHLTKGKFNAMNFPQMPLVTTDVPKILNFDAVSCSGQNAMVMICPWYGFGQEDSIIMNQDSIDRGFMNITTYIAFDAKVRIDKNEVFEIPNKEECANFRGNINSLDENGIVKRGTIVKEGDILIGRTIVNKESKSKIVSRPKTNISIIYDHQWPGKIHNIIHDTDGKGYSFYKIVVAQQRDVQYGDKFSAAHGQKGTVGMTYRSEDLPQTSNGLVPDIIVNPLAFPSRMTLGMLFESIKSRLVITSRLKPESREINHEKCGDEIVYDDELTPKNKTNTYNPASSDYDATPFNEKYTIPDILEELNRLGVDNFCEERVVNGQTGEEMTSLIYTGTVFYQRLKHMVIDKMHARARGGKARLTRQPKEGRNAGGGLRVGYMEKDTLMAQGVPHFIKDRLMEQSDETKAWYCTSCGLQNDDSFTDKVKTCKNCGSNDINFVSLPYATKLLTHELAGLGIITRILS